MAHSENVMVMMRRYLTALSKRIDDLTLKASQLESELGKLSLKQETDNAGLSEKMDEFTGVVEEARAGIDQAKEELKKSLEEVEANLEGYASYDAITEIQNKVDRQLDTMRDEKLDRSDFQEFMDTYFTPLEELFEEREAGGGFADFATSQAAPQEEKPSEESVMAPTEEDETAKSLAQTLTPDLSSAIEPKRHEKRKKKWI